MEREDTPEREAGYSVAEYRAGDPSGGVMAPEERATEWPAWNRRKDVQREIRERPRACDDHGYNRREDGDTQSGGQHAPTPYHAPFCLASVAPEGHLKGPL